MRYDQGDKNKAATLIVNSYPKISLAVTSPAKLLTKAVNRVATPQTNIINESHFAAFVFFKTTFEGTSNII